MRLMNPSKKIKEFFVMTIDIRTKKQRNRKIHDCIERFQIYTIILIKECE